MKKKREYSVPIREQMVPWLFLLPSLLFVSIMVLIPMLDALRRSFFLAAGDVCGISKLSVSLEEPCVSAGGS